MKLGSTLQIGRYNLLLQSFESRPEKNYTAERMIIEVSEDNKPKMMMYPERRFFPTNEESGTMVAIYSTLRDDLYVVYSGAESGQADAGDSCVSKSLVKWIWLGGAIVVMGTFVALLPNRRTVLALCGLDGIGSCDRTGHRVGAVATGNIARGP